MASTSDVTAWLEQLGLGKYAATFAKNEIDLDILPELSDDDLKDIGLPLGPRRKIQIAIAQLHEKDRSPESGDNAERRHLTVMFADLVGSSEMSTRMDPEDLRELMREFQNVSTAAIERFSGFVARYMGDGVLAYFGYPQAHEDDPERSVRAGLELVRLTAALNGRLSVDKKNTLRVRVGIATGPVVVGDLIGEGVSSERAVVGETPNIAARIEASAPIDSVVVGEDTHKLLGERFETEELGARSFKGFTRPIRLYRIVAERRVESRFKATRAGSQVRFVGRTEELGTLLQGWSAARSAEGGACLISGEAGVGKSRLLQEFLNSVAESDANVIQYQCSPFHTNTAFYPIVEQLTAIAQIPKDSVEDMRRAHLTRLILGTQRPKEESLQLLASLLSVPLDGSLPSNLRDNPAKLLDATQDLITEQILARADSGPVLLVFEDAHWMDPTTIDTAIRLSRACEGHRLFIIVTSRPLATVDETIGECMPSLKLSRLSQEETETLVRSIPDGNSLSPSAFKAVVQRADGIPLFVEELTKLVLERGDADGASTSSIPTTLVDSLTERLDRLGSAKELAQIGAIIGREFSLDLLSHIDGRDQASRQCDIERLIDAELIQEIGSGGAPAYRFKHALVQDAAYSTLLHAKRREHHARIADVFLNIFPEIARDKPELIAHHLNEGGRSLEAVNHWQLAGRDATSRSANAEAIHHISRGIAVLNSLPTLSIENLHKELELQIALGPPLVAARGYASPDLQAAYSRALEIGEKLDDGITDFRVLWGLSSFYLIRGQLQQSLKLQRECATQAQKDAKIDRRVQASAWLGTILFYRCEFEEAEKWLRKVGDDYRGLAASWHGFQYGLDASVLARTHLVWLHWLRGETEQAHTLDEETLTFARTLDHPLSYVHALNFSVVLQTFQGNHSEAFRRADRLFEMSSELEFPHYIAYSRIMRGLALAKLGSVDEGIDEMIAGLQARRDTGAELVRPMFLTMLAEILANSGQIARSIAALDEADSIVAQNGERWYLSESRRVRGVILGKQSGGRDAAFKQILCALEDAQSCGSKSIEMRALLSLIELQGKRADHGANGAELLQRLANLVAETSESMASLDRKRSCDLLSELGYG